MVVDFHNQIARISKNLGEPETLLRWRGYMHTLSQTLSKKTSYGLAIGIDQERLVVPYGISADHKLPSYQSDSRGNVHIYPWKEAITKEEVTALLHDVSQKMTVRIAKDYYAATNAALFEQGYVVVCPVGASAHVSLTSVLGGNMSDMIVVVAEEGAQLSFFDNVESTGGQSARTIIGVVRENASLNYTYSYKGSGEVYTNIVSDVATGGSVSFLHVDLVQQGLLKIDAQHYLSGEGATIEAKDVIMSLGSAVADVTDIVHHTASHTASNMHASGVASGESKIIYRSNIVMKEKGTGDLKGKQKAQFLNLSKKTEIDAIPSLDIGQKDVTCSHSVSVSFLKENDTYYARLRGIEKNEAGKMIVEGLLFRELENGGGCRRHCEEPATKQSRVSCRDIGGGINSGLLRYARNDDETVRTFSQSNADKIRENVQTTLDVVPFL